jgi:two-component system, OmpR family, phosphate regulon sensor histidine kinase PhoR
VFHSRLLWKTWGVFGTIIILGTLVFGYLTTNEVEKDARNNIESLLISEAYALKQLFIPYLLERRSLNVAEATRLTEGIDHRVTIIDSDGGVLGDNWKDFKIMDNHATRSEVQSAATESLGMSERYSRTVVQNMLYVALSVNLNGTHIGFIRIAVPLSSVEKQLSTLRWRIVGIALFIGFLFLILGFVLARVVTRPITEMTLIASDISDGNYSLRLPEGRFDEIGELSRVLNKLALGAEDRIEALTSNRNQLEAVLGGLSEGVVAVDLNQVVLHANDSACSILGYEQKELSGLQLKEVVTVSELSQLVNRCFLEHSAIQTTVRVASIVLNITVTPLDGENETAVGAIIVIQDVTQVKRSEQVRRDFVANASHELKTPIAAIRGFIETIIDDPHMDEDTQRHFLDRSRAQVDRLGNIVQDLIDLSRFDAGDSVGRKEPVDLADVLRTVIAEKQDHANLEKVRLDIELQIDTLPMDGDQDGIHQMVTNLVDNAIKHSKEGGAVSLRLSRKASNAVIEVEDTGMGIPSEEQQRIFERFYRVDRARSRVKGGTGLGLSIVKHVSQTHGGTVHVQSQLDKGSVFTVELPIVTSAAATPPSG